MLRYNMWKVVVQNLLYFMHDLVPAAYQCSAWTKDDVDRAISWSSYCEKVVKHLDQKAGFQVSLHRMVEKYEWILSSQQLRCARLHLFRLFFQNQLLEREIQCYIKEKALEALGKEVTENLSQEVKQQAEDHEELMNRLYESKTELNSKFQTSLLLEASNSLTVDQMQIQFRQVLSSFGLELLLRATLLQRKDTNISKASAVVVKWLESVLQLRDDSTLYKSVVTQLSTLDPVILCNVVAVNQSFSFVLLEALKNETGKLSPCYKNGQCTWTPSESNCDLLIEFKDIVSICKNLTSDDSIALPTKKVLSSWCLEDGGMIWSEVVCELERQHK